MKLLQLRLDEYLEEPISFSLDVPREGVILTGVSGTGKTQAIDLIKCAAEQQNLSVFVPDSDLSLAKFSEKLPEELTLVILDSDMLPSSEVFDLFKAAQAKDNLYAVWISRGESLFDQISSPILIPYHTKYTYTFTHRFKYAQPSVINSLKSDRDSVEKSDEVFNSANASEQNLQELKDYLFSLPPESQDSDSSQLD